MRRLVILCLTLLPAGLSGCNTHEARKVQSVQSLSPAEFPAAPNPRDTPIVVTGGSITIGSANTWAYQVDGSFTTTMSGEIKRISVADKNPSNTERAYANPKTKTPWTVHLITTKNDDVAIAGTSDASGSVLHVQALAPTVSGAEWYMSHDNTGITLVTDHDKIDHVVISVGAGVADVTQACQTADADGTQTTGHCKIHFRLKDSSPAPDPTH